MKFHKGPVIFFVATFCIQLNMAHNHRYADQAGAWTNKMLQADLSSEEKTILSNVLYWSWQRSVTILTLQSAVVDYTQKASTVLNGTMGARLNPAKLSSILDYKTSDWQTDLNAFDKAHKLMRDETVRYRAVAATYAHCLEYCLKTDNVRAQVKELIAEVRELSRAARMQVLQEQATSVSLVMAQIKKVMNGFSEGPMMRNVTADDDETRGIIAYIAQMVTPALFNSFARFDKKYNICNERLWQALTVSYGLSAILWKIIEQTRADFYQTYYATLMQALSSHDDTQHNLRTVFDADGFVQPPNRHDV